MPFWQGRPQQKVLYFLKNDKETLPLKKGTVVSVFGRIQLSYYKSGTGSGGLVNPPYTVGILDALKEEKDICLNTELLDIYEKWVSAHPFDLGDGWVKRTLVPGRNALFSTEQVQRAAEISNIAIVILGKNCRRRPGYPESKRKLLFPHIWKKSSGTDSCRKRTIPARADCCRILTDVYNGTLVNASASAKMLDLLNSAYRRLRKRQLLCG